MEGFLEHPPYKGLLRTRGIAQDEKCDLCGSCETFGHILWGCELIGLVWGNTKIKLLGLEIIPSDFIYLVWEIKNKRPELDWELFAVTAWSLWNNRNSVCHRG